MATFKLKKFDDLTLRELYELLALRGKVFVVEQKCNYLDADGVDFEADHVLMLVMGKIVGCSRLFKDHGVVKIGRVVVDSEYRGTGLGKALMMENLRILKERKTTEEIHLHAQVRLLKFYQGVGFKEYGDVFLEDGLDHIMMKYVEME